MKKKKKKKKEFRRENGVGRGYLVTVTGSTWQVCAVCVAVTGAILGASGSPVA